MRDGYKFQLLFHGWIHITGKIDTGHNIYETQFPINSTDTGLTVSVTCMQKGLELIEKLLNESRRAPLSIPSQPQDLSQRVYIDSQRYANI